MAPYYRERIRRATSPVRRFSLSRLEERIQRVSHGVMLSVVPRQLG